MTTALLRSVARSKRDIRASNGCIMLAFIGLSIHSGGHSCPSPKLLYTTDYRVTSPFHINVKLAIVLEFFVPNSIILDLLQEFVELICVRNFYL